MNIIKAKVGEVVKPEEAALVGKLKQKYTELLNVANQRNVLKYKLDQMPIASAIIIFEKPKSKDVCLNAHDRYAPKNGYGRKPPLDFLFRGHYHLEVTSAPEPNSIYWENYNENSCRKLIFIVIFVIMILISLLITFSFKIQIFGI